MTDISTNDLTYHQLRQIKLRKIPQEEPSLSSPLYSKVSYSLAI